MPDPLFPYIPPIQPLRACSCGKQTYASLFKDGICDHCQHRAEAEALSKGFKESEAEVSEE